MDGRHGHWPGDTTAFTLRELIAKLQEFDWSLRVVFSGEDYMYFVRGVSMFGNDEAMKNVAGAVPERLPRDSVVLIS